MHRGEEKKGELGEGQRKGKRKFSIRNTKPVSHSVTSFQAVLDKLFGFSPNAFRGQRLIKMSNIFKWASCPSNF
jgi:hypothetical protein